MAMTEQQKQMLLHKAEIRAKEKAFIDHPTEWPLWPFLPMKRYGKGATFPESGVMFSERTIVYLCSVYDLEKICFLSIEDLDRFFDKYKKIDYQSIEAILDDGWMVD